MFLKERLQSDVRGWLLPAVAAAFAAGLGLGLGFGVGLGLFWTARPLADPRSVSAQPLASLPVSKPDGEKPGRPSAARNAPRAIYPAEVLRVIDGDTFEARVPLWPGLDVTTRVRIRDLDTPELRARCDAERRLAFAARDELQRLLDRGAVGVARVTLDKYGGRVVADVSADAVPDIAAALIAAGLGRRYDGGRRVSWCA
jgi:endonuclease YncB( thermonuclease family)